MQKLTIPLTPAQCRAARALLNWSQEDLVEACKITKRTIAEFERGASKPHQNTLVQIIAGFEAAGIEFLHGKAPGVRIHTRSEPTRAARRMRPHVR